MNLFDETDKAYISEIVEHLRSGLSSEENYIVDTVPHTEDLVLKLSTVIYVFMLKNVVTSQLDYEMIYSIAYDHTLGTLKNYLLGRRHLLLD